MTRHLVVGAGPTGFSTARILADAGDDVRIVARTPGPTQHARIERLALDASDVGALVTASEDARTIFMCAMPRYDRWPEEFPPILESTVGAAERVGARIVMVGNVYGYGEDAPDLLVESLPLRPTTVKGRVRAAMWERARASRAPATEVRGSDYLGRGAISIFSLLVAPKIVAGEPVVAPVDFDAVRPWTFVEDVARTLVAASRNDASWGRAFHVPSQHASLRQVATRFAELAGLPPPSLVQMPRSDLEALGRTDTVIREVVEMAYLLERPFVLDAKDTERTLSVYATSLDAMLRDTLRTD